jgi:GT2 family glycosyltransferase
MMRPVNVVVVAYNAAEQLDRCLAALGTGTEVTVVDNSSSSAVRAVAEKRGAAYVDPGRNLGFGAGANVALQQLLEGSPRDVLLLNPDAILEPGELGKLTRCLHRAGNERLGAVAPRLVCPSGLEQRVVWPFPTPLRAWAEAIGLGRLPAHNTFVIGAVLLLRWEALNEVGLFDERYFLYAEETDWQRRALALGWTSGLCRDALGVHVGAGTAADPKRRETLFHAAQETYMRKWYGSSGWLTYRLAACAGAAARTLMLGGERRAEAARRARLYALGPRRCAGLAGSS